MFATFGSCDKLAAKKHVTTFLMIMPSFHRHVRSSVVPLPLPLFRGAVPSVSLPFAFCRAVYNGTETIRIFLRSAVEALTVEDTDVDFICLDKVPS